VIAIILFLAFWVLLAVALFFIALRGGLTGARDVFQTQTQGGRKIVATMFAIVYAGFGIVVPAVLLIGNHDKASGHVGLVKLTAAEKRGRELFGQQCSVCHTLAAANAVGKVGPNLDELRPPASLVENTIANGCLQNPPPNSPQTCLGSGTMPAQLLQGRDAKDVAQFVAKVAGK
jgi:hypothetical protein